MVNVQANIKIIKLTNGDDIVTHMPSGDKQLPDKSPLMRLDKPLQIKYIPQMTPMGVRDYIALIKWTNYTPDKIITIPKDKILTITTAGGDMSKSYLNLAKEYDQIDSPKKSKTKIYHQEQINEEDNEMLNEIFRDFKHPKRTLH
mgnify:CR=1 FL=1|jgi:hypothetical protein|tara:strand:- start:71 stop:505 length:435 start_codon:yes stop_codon:yes gene_type:complete